MPPRSACFEAGLGTRPADSASAPHDHPRTPIARSLNAHRAALWGLRVELGGAGARATEVAPLEEHADDHRPGESSPAQRHPLNASPSPKATPSPARGADRKKPRVKGAPEVRQRPPVSSPRSVSIERLSVAKGDAPSPAAPRAARMEPRVERRFAPTGSRKSARGNHARRALPWWSGADAPDSPFTPANSSRDAPVTRASCRSPTTCAPHPRGRLATPKPRPPRGEPLGVTQTRSHSTAWVRRTSQSEQRSFPWETTAAAARAAIAAVAATRAAAAEVATRAVAAVAPIPTGRAQPATLPARTAATTRLASNTIIV